MVFMTYPIINIEITKPLTGVQLPEGDNGVGLIIRYQGKPIGFLIEDMPEKKVLNGTELEQLINKNLGVKLLQEKVKRELKLPENLPNFSSLTVAICTKDRPENLARCLNSVIQLQISGDNLLFEIIVVDNAPSDERTKQLVSSLPSVRYTREVKPGLDFARNCALQAASGELLAFLDDDVVVDRQWLKGLKEAWAENPDAGGLTGLVLPYELETEAQILFEKRGGFRRGFEKIRYGKILPGNLYYPCGAGTFGAGCNMTFRREILLKLGGFDEALDTGKPLPGGGDLDIFYRVVRAGYPMVYEPQYLVFHQHRRDLKSLRRQYWTWGLGLMAFVVKSYQQDPENQVLFRGLVKWWFKDMVHQLAGSLLRRHILSPEMILAELWGGIIGLLGEYPRSVKRIEKIRKQFPNESSFILN